MSDTNLPRGLFFAILAAGIAQCVHDFPLLPDRIATHFSASGVPNGWMTKSQFLITYAVVILPAIAVGFWTPRKIAQTPDAKFRLPNKDYWLAPGQRAGTIEYFRKFFNWYGCAFLFVEVCVMGLAMRANLNSPPRMPTVPIVSVLVAFVLSNAVAVFATVRRFSKPV
jgi:uncharacterized membrane protein